MQFGRLKRREFITFIGTAATAWPLASRAQQPVIPVVGFMTSLGQNDRPNLRDAFRRGLSEVGFVEGRNIGKSEPTGIRSYDKRRAGGDTQLGPAVACAQRQHPKGDQRRLRDSAAAARRRALCWWRSVFYQSASAGRRASDS